MDICTLGLRGTCVTLKARYVVYIHSQPKMVEPILILGMENTVFSFGGGGLFHP
jgi:hypothetical protein